MNSLKVAENSVLSMSTNLESKLINCFVLLNFYCTVSFGSLQPFTVRKIPHLLLALASNNQFVIKLVKMWSGRTGQNFEDKPRSIKKKKKSLVECCSVICCE